MRNRMITVAGILVLAASVLAGCSKTKPVVETSETLSEVVSEAVSEIESNEPSEEVSEDDYAAFINGEEKVLCNVLRGKEQEYSLDELLSVWEDWWGLDEFEYSYGFIDCGNDGVPELVIKQCVLDWDNFNNYVIIKKKDGQLETIAYYEGSLNKYGVNSVIDNEYRFIDADGNDIFIYSIDYEGGLGETWVEGSMLPSVGLPTDYPQERRKTISDLYGGEYEELIPYGDIERRLYSFKESPLTTTGSAWESYKKQQIIVFTKNGEDIAPDEKYSKIYSDIGVEVCNNSQIEEKIQARLLELGISEEVYLAEEPDWIPLSD